MELILIVLTSTILSACFIYAFKLGYDKGYEKGSRDSREGVEISKANRRILQEYANFVSYDGEERGD